MLEFNAKFCNAINSLEKKCNIFLPQITNLLRIWSIISPPHQHLVALLAVPTIGFKYQEVPTFFFHYHKVLYDYSFIFPIFRWKNSCLTSFCRIKFRYGKVQRRQLITFRWWAWLHQSSGINLALHLRSLKKYDAQISPEPMKNGNPLRCQGKDISVFSGESNGQTWLRLLLNLLRRQDVIFTVGIRKSRE